MKKGFISKLSLALTLTLVGTNNIVSADSSKGYDQYVTDTMDYYCDIYNEYLPEIKEYFNTFDLEFEEGPGNYPVEGYDLVQYSGMRAYGSPDEYAPGTHEVYYDASASGNGTNDQVIICMNTLVDADEMKSKGFDYETSDYKPMIDIFFDDFDFSYLEEFIDNYYRLDGDTNADGVSDYDDDDTACIYYNGCSIGVDVYSDEIVVVVRLH